MFTPLSGGMVYNPPYFPKEMVHTTAFLCSVTSASDERPIEEGCHGGGTAENLSDSPLCAMSSGAHATDLQGLSCAHKVSCDSPGEFGKLSSASNRSAGPTLGVHSAWACHAALSSVHDSGLHSSELAVRLANEYGMPCRTRSCSRWLMMRLKMACAPGAVRPNCSSTTGVMPLSSA